jgi:hypothetical protein
MTNIATKQSNLAVLYYFIAIIEAGRLPYFTFITLNLFDEGWIDAIYCNIL